MAATVREVEKGSGVWYVFVTHEGRRKAKKVGSKRAAEAVAAEINKQIIAGSFNLTKKDERTFRHYAERWIENCINKPATKKNYLSLLDKHIIPAFGNASIDTINRLDVKDFLKNKLLDGYTTSTVNNIRACLSNVFETALDDGAIQSNPAARLGRLSQRKQHSHRMDEVRFFTKEELVRLLNGFRKLRPKHYLLALLLARTGCRVGEAVALQWRDIDFDAMTIHIQRAKSRTIVDTTKSGEDRYVDMSRQLADELKLARMDMISKAIRSGRRVEWIFHHNGKPIDQDAWKRKNFNAICKAVGLGPRLVKDLRHTYASLMLYHGKSLKYVQTQLGHSTITLTADTYSHLIPNPDHGSVDVLEDTQSKNTLS